MFWLFLIVFICIDTYVFLQGYDSILYSYKTPNELKAQARKLRLEGDS